MIDAPEVQRIIDSVLGAGLVQLSILLEYYEAKKEIIESEELTH
jgi:hypothetical protein